MRAEWVRCPVCGAKPVIGLERIPFLRSAINHNGTLH